MRVAFAPDQQRRTRPSGFNLYRLAQTRGFIFLARLRSCVRTAEWSRRIGKRVRRSRIGCGFCRWITAQVQHAFLGMFFEHHRAGLATGASCAGSQIALAFGKISFRILDCLSSSIELSFDETMSSGSSRRFSPVDESLRRSPLQAMRRGLICVCSYKTQLPDRKRIFRSSPPIPTGRRCLPATLRWRFILGYTQGIEDTVDRGRRHPRANADRCRLVGGARIASVALVFLFCVS